jgi:hypothetical protein
LGDTAGYKTLAVCTETTIRKRGCDFVVFSAGWAAFIDERCALHDVVLVLLQLQDFLIAELDLLLEAEIVACEGLLLLLHLLDLCVASIIVKPTIPADVEDVLERGTLCFRLLQGVFLPVALRAQLA